MQFCGIVYSRHCNTCDWDAFLLRNKIERNRDCRLLTGLDIQSPATLLVTFLRRLEVA